MWGLRKVPCEAPPQKPASPSAAQGGKQPWRPPVEESLAVLFHTHLTAVSCARPSTSTCAECTQTQTVRRRRKWASQRKTGKRKVQRRRKNRIVKNWLPVLASNKESYIITLLNLLHKDSSLSFIIFSVVHFVSILLTLSFSYDVVEVGKEIRTLNSRLGYSQPGQAAASRYDCELIPHPGACTHWETVQTVWGRCLGISLLSRSTSQFSLQVE